MNNGHVAARERRFAQVDVFTTRAAMAIRWRSCSMRICSIPRRCNASQLDEPVGDGVRARRPRRAADFRLRIFTPRQELPFAGHPTVGAAHAVLEARPQLAERHRLTLECAAGLLPVRIERNGASPRIFVEAPTATFEPTAASLPVDLVLCGAPLGHAAPRLVDVGARWLVAEFADAASVRAMQPDFARIAELTTRERNVVGLCVFARETGGDAAIAVRAFCPPTAFRKTRSPAARMPQSRHCAPLLQLHAPALVGATRALATPPTSNACAGSEFRSAGGASDTWARRCGRRWHGERELLVAPSR